MKFDQLMKVLGEFGKYQKIRFILICIFAMVSAWHALNMVFVGPAHKFRCNVAGVNLTNTPLANISYAEREKLFLPKGEDNACYEYDVKQTMSLLENSGYNWSLISSSNVTRDKVSCSDGYEFSTKIYKTSLTSEFNLVCDRKFWRPTSKSVFFAGRLLGAVTFGQLSDKYGRRPLFFVGVILLVVAGTVASFASSMYLFLPMYCLQGAAHTGAFLVSFTLATELVGPKYRVVVGYVNQIFYSFGYMTLAGIAYFIREWRYLEVAITAPAILFGIYYWFLPESVRWLLSHDKDVEAEKTLMQVAKENGVTLDPDIIKALKTDPTLRSGGRSYNFFDCLRTWPMARLSLNIWFNWLVNALVYYGLSLNTENLAGSNYLNFCVAGAVEIPAYILCILFLNKVGRRWPLIFTMYLGGIACILSGCVPKDSGLEALTVTLAMIGKFGITASYSIIYLLAAEIYPTVIRNIGMGVSSMSARIGGILAPVILDLQSVSAPLPIMIFGILALIAGSLGYLLPETAGKPLPQLPEEVDHGMSCMDALRCRKPDKSKNTEDMTDLKEMDEMDNKTTLHLQVVSLPAPCPAVLNTELENFGSGRKGKQVISPPCLYLECHKEHHIFKCCPGSWP